MTTNSDIVKLNDLLDIEYPIILAPMFLISNVKMTVSALESGITAAIPALNFRSPKLLAEALINIRRRTNKPFGINLIVNKSNIYLKKQLEVCLNHHVDYIITALGSPKSIIDQCHDKGIKVFCDVINERHAEKASEAGADALIAINSNAGGHLGIEPAEILIPKLRKITDRPIISAGGVANKSQFNKIMELGASGCSIGSIFIASHESPVSQEYKNAIVEYGAKDIVITKKLSGSPCTVINTPYVRSIGTEQNKIEKFLNQHKRLKRYFKLIIGKKGMNTLHKAAFSATYKTVWTAGKSIEYVQSIRNVNEIVNELVE